MYLAAVWLQRQKLCLSIFTIEKNLKLVWNFLFPMESWVRNHWKCYRSGGVYFITNTSRKAISKNREVIEDLPYISRPSPTVNENNIEKVKETVFESLRVDIKGIAEDLNISYGSTKPFGLMKRGNAWLVPKDLNHL